MILGKRGIYGLRNLLTYREMKAPGYYVLIMTDILQGLDGVYMVVIVSNIAGD